MERQCNGIFVAERHWILKRRGLELPCCISAFSLCREQKVITQNGIWKGDQVTMLLLFPTQHSSCHYVECVAGAALWIVGGWSIPLKGRTTQAVKLKWSQGLSQTSAPGSCRDRQVRHWEKHRSSIWRKFLENECSHGERLGDNRERVFRTFCFICKYHYIADRVLRQGAKNVTPGLPKEIQTAFIYPPGERSWVLGYTVCYCGKGVWSCWLTHWSCSSSERIYALSWSQEETDLK